MDRASGADGHSDGQTDSNSDRKNQDKDYKHLTTVYDADDTKIYRELINLYGYKPAIARKTLMRNNPDIKKITDRGAGVKIDIREDAQDEKRMMRQQLMFMAYAAKEIAAYVDRVADPEEWYQNKMATTHSMMKTLYSYAQGQMQSMNADDDLMAGYYGEEITKLDARRREFKEKLRKLAYEKYGKKKVDAVDKAELDEETWKEIEAYAKKHGGIDKKDMLKVAMMLKKGDRKGAEKYARGLDTDPRDWLLDKMDETLEEANFKPGSLKLNDGSKVKISMDDAKAITAVMKTLSTKNRKEMETRMMADKKGFDEIMAFVDAAGM